MFLACAFLFLWLPSSILASDVRTLSHWVERLEEVQQEWHELEAHAADLTAAYSRARRNRQPRGEARAALTQELAETRASLEALREAWPRLLEQARRDGVSPGVLASFEPPVAAPR